MKKKGVNNIIVPKCWLFPLLSCFPLLYSSRFPLFSCLPIILTSISIIFFLFFFVLLSYFLVFFFFLDAGVSQYSTATKLSLLLKTEPSIQPKMKMSLLVSHLLLISITSCLAGKKKPLCILTNYVNTINMCLAMKYFMCYQN